MIPLFSVITERLRLCREDDTKWPPKNKDGRQELEIRMGGEHISFEVSSLTDYYESRLTYATTDSKDWSSS